MRRTAIASAFVVFAMASPAFADESTLFLMRSEVAKSAFALLTYSYECRDAQGAGFYPGMRTAVEDAMADVGFDRSWAVSTVNSWEQKLEKSPPPIDADQARCLATANEKSHDVDSTRAQLREYIAGHPDIAKP
jgi:hypothetical protein